MLATCKQNHTTLFGMARTHLPDRACLTCLTAFRPTRTWQRFCSPACRTQAHRDERTAKYICDYCGLLADTVDHVPPLSVRPALIELKLAPRYHFVEVRSCRECNTALGARPLWTISQRKQFLIKWITRRYDQYLQIPNWTEGELAKLSETLQDCVLDDLAVRDLTRHRLRRLQGQ